MAETPHPASTVPRWQLQLLPGDGVDAGRSRSARDWVVDLCLLGFALLTGAGAVSELWNDADKALKLVQLVLGLVAVASLWWRRVAPIRVAVLVLVLSVFCLGAAGAAFVVIFNAAIRCSRTALIWISVLGTASLSVAPHLYKLDTKWGDVIASVVVVLVFVGWGLFVRAQRGLVASLRVQAERAELDRAADLDRARDAERRRIAREMHDVLAHRISMVGLHAGALEHRGSDAPEADVEAAAGVIRASAAAAMDELRDIIGVLRDGSIAASTDAPQPTIAAVPALIEENRAAGLVIDATIEVPPHRPVHTASELAVFRVVQEGLTNARRHAPGSSVAVSIRARGDDLTVRVVTARGDEPSDRSVVSASDRSGGKGLIGLTERVTLAGGTLEYGPSDGDTFVLEATIPGRA